MAQPKISASDLPIYTFSGQWGSTPFNLILQLGTPPANGGFGVLDITMYHCAHQHGLVGAKGGHDTLSYPWHLCASDSGEWLFRGRVFLLMTLRLSFSALYSLAYMSAFNTPASSIPVWTSTKHFSLQICSSESISHFFFRIPSSNWGFLRGLRNLGAST